MSVSLEQIKAALDSLGADTTNLNQAIESLTFLLDELNELEVKGRQNVDTLLGCMMAVEAIIGKKEAS